MVYPNGAKQGSVIVDARSPWKHTVNEFKNLAVGKKMYGLAVDHEARELIFPGYGEQRVFVLVEKALKLAEKTKLAAKPDFLTGLYWKLELRSFVNGKWFAEPLEILV